MQIETILFDLDDTLLNGKRAARIFARTLCDKNQDNLRYRVSDEQIEEMLGLKSKNFSSRERLFITLYKNYPWINEPTLPQILEFWAEYYPKSSYPVDGLDKTLKAILEKGIKIAVVTNGPKEFQRAKIKALSLDRFFKEYVISEEVGYKKPEKEIYEIALKKLSAKKETTVFVGDNPKTDILGAFNIGMKTAWMSNEYIWNEDNFKPDFTLDSFNEILNIL